MGIFWRLFAPKPLKNARRTARKAAHPVRTATRAMTPQPVKKMQRTAHPFDLAELKAEDAVVNALRGKRRSRVRMQAEGARRAAGPWPKAPPKSPESPGLPRWPYTDPWDHPPQ
jgi:hypothetical protein